MIPQVIGANIARARKEQRFTQAGIGEALAPFLGKVWSRQAVNAAERGRRAFTAEEVLAFAIVLEVPFHTLFRPEDELEPLVFSTGETVEWAEVVGADERETDVFENLGAIRSALDEAREYLDSISHLAWHGGTLRGRQGQRYRSTADRRATR